MRIGILELLVDSRSKTPVDFAYRILMKKTYASVMPQAVAVWCQRLGHEVFYATYLGERDPRRLLPADLDLLFISTYTQSSPLAYALSKLYRADGVLTVVGGPHAKAFPADCSRFFDWVVMDCDEALIGDLVRGTFDRGAVVTTGRPPRDLPRVAERAPFIEAATFVAGRRSLSSNVPLLSSVGCPYSCDFCVDGATPYALLPLDGLEDDLRFIAKRWPGIWAAFHDPNFGVKFDDVLGVMEKFPPKSRVPYVMESSLSLLKPDRLKRLRDTNCFYIAPGVESWQDYSAKAGVGRSTGREKLEQVVSHFHEIAKYVGGLQANFIFGTATDRGDEPIALTKEFFLRTPHVWPTLNIPTPFGGTPLFDKHLGEGRVLKEIPFAFYYTPFLVTRLDHYDPITYYDHLAELFSVKTSARMLGRRLASNVPPHMKMLFVLRTLALRQQLKVFRQVRRLLRDDPDFLAFHEGRSRSLPAYYRHAYDRKLGPYASLLSPADRTPLLEPSQEVVGRATTVTVSSIAPPARLPGGAVPAPGLARS